MRLKTVLVLACAATVASLALLAGGASAFRHLSPGGRCRVSMQVAPRRITAGEPVVIFGRLVCLGRASAAGQTVRLFRHIPGTPGFTLVQSTTTDANGGYQFQPAEATVETNRIWHVRSHGAESANRGVRVEAKVTLSGPPEGTQIVTGPANKVTFTGTVAPADVGARVILQRQNGLTGDEWHRIDSSRVVEGGGFTIVHTFKVPGDADLRVVVRSQGRNTPGISNILSYEISQEENPELTIVASADPIAFGQSVTISGTLAGGVDQPVTLLARTVHQRGFAPVAQATTNSTGAYVFPAQTPVNNTFYRVEGEGTASAAHNEKKTSAVLYEGVRDVLSAKVSATTVLEGQTLMFTGSVAPTHPGHVIYLERKDPSGEGFHIVQVGILSQESTFSISYEVYSVGSQVYRVYIPGGPENGRASSQLFTIQVNPAPAGMLAPESSSNSSSPSEGSTSEREREGEQGEGQGAEKEGQGAEGEAPHGGHHHHP
jgi:hypothetical protein